MRDYMNNIISFDYLNEWNSINLENANKELQNRFLEDKMVLSIVNPK